MALVSLEGVFRYYMRMVLIGVSREIEYELRNDLFRHLTRLSAALLPARSRIGDLMSRATNDMSAVRMVLGPGIMYTANTVATFVGTVALMLTISPAPPGLALVPLVLVSVLVRHFGRQIHDRFEEVQAQLSDHDRPRPGEPLGRAGGAGLRPGAARGGPLRRGRTRSTCARNRGLIRLYRRASTPASSS